MKQKFLVMLLAGALAGFSSKAQNAGDVIIDAGDFKAISVASNIDVVLLANSGNPPGLSISKQAAAELDITMAGETLKLEPKHWSKKAKVYIRVQYLKKLTIGESTVVRIDGIITTPQLELFIDAESKVYFKTIGKVNVHSPGDNDVTIQPVTGNTSVVRAF
jgi:hypothetical protein